jgi:uncharacterized protein YciI
MAMWYVIHFHDRPGSLPLRREHRPRHLARLRALQDEGRLFAAGPLPAIDSPDPGEAGFVGSLMILEFESLDAARTWAADDPFLECGAYERFEVQPFIKTLP